MGILHTRPSWADPTPLLRRRLGRDHVVQALGPEMAWSQKPGDARAQNPRGYSVVPLEVAPPADEEELRPSSGGQQYKHQLLAGRLLFSGGSAQRRGTAVATSKRKRCLVSSLILGCLLVGCALWIWAASIVLLRLNAQRNCAAAEDLPVHGPDPVYGPEPELREFAERQSALAERGGADLHRLHILRQRVTQAQAIYGPQPPVRPPQPTTRVEGPQTDSRPMVRTSLPALPAPPEKEQTPCHRVL